MKLTPYSLVLPAALALAQRALAAAAILARAAGLMVRLPLAAGFASPAAAWPLCLAQRALAAAMIAALPAGLRRRLGLASFAAVPFCLAHLARWAAAILALAAGLILRLPAGRPLAARGAIAGAPRSLFSSFCSASICSLISTARLSCSTEIFSNSIAICGVLLQKMDFSQGFTR